MRSIVATRSGLAAETACIRIMRLYRGRQNLPWRHPVRFRQEHLPSFTLARLHTLDVTARSCTDHRQYRSALLLPKSWALFRSPPGQLLQHVRLIWGAASGEGGRRTMS